MTNENQSGALPLPQENLPIVTSSATSETLTVAEALGDERFRPRFHFTPRRNWMNDPNGLVYFEGEYHLFYQYNPEGKDWGNMSWGHAISSDLVDWHELSVAIPYTDVMIFSGSAVVDWHNESGLGDGRKPPLLAYYTAFDPQTDVQSQHLVFSHDCGRSFIHYSANPIIDLDLADFRDPKVFYHAASAAWVMIVALARDHIVRFYRSNNLRDWTDAGAFGPAGSTGGQWECPDLFEVPVEGESDQVHWVLKVDVDTGFVDGGSGAQYFVGDFDGHIFTVDPNVGNPHGDRVDMGPDFYAAVTWSNLPEGQPAPIWIGWQSNQQSGKHYPTDPWRGVQSVPRRLFLFSEETKLKLGQLPIERIDDLRGDPWAMLTRFELGSGQEKQVALPTATTDIEFDVHLDAQSILTLELNDAGGTIVTVTFDHASGTIAFGRCQAEPAFSEGFSRNTSTPFLIPETVAMRVLLDQSTLEIFIDGGRRVYSACIFPQGELILRFASVVGLVSIEQLRAWPMTPAIARCTHPLTAHDSNLQYGVHPSRFPSVNL